MAKLLLEDVFFFWQSEFAFGGTSQRFASWSDCVSGLVPSAMERDLVEWWPLASTSWYSLQQGEDRLQWLAWNVSWKKQCINRFCRGKKTVYMLWFDGLFLSQTHLDLFPEFWKARKREVNLVSLQNENFPCCGWVVTAEHRSLCSHKSHHAHTWWLRVSKAVS